MVLTILKNILVNGKDYPISLWKRTNMFETTSQISLGEHMKFSLSYPFPNREKGPLKETIWGSPTASSRMPASTKGNPAAWPVPLKRYPHKVMMAVQLWKSPLDGKKYSWENHLTVVFFSVAMLWLPDIGSFALQTLWDLDASIYQQYSRTTTSTIRHPHSMIPNVWFHSLLFTQGCLRSERGMGLTHYQW